MDAVVDLLAVMVFLTVVLAFLFLRSLRSKGRENEQTQAYLDALKASVADEEQGGIGRESAEDILRDLESNPFSNWPLIGDVLGRVWLGLSVIGWRAGLKKRLVLLAMISLVAGMALGKETPFPMAASLGFAVLAFVILFSLGYRQALGKHMKELRQGLPEAIDAITRTARAGVPVSNAFALVADSLPGPLVQEFRLVDNWLRLGMPLRRAIQDSARRVPLNEYRFFAVILIINQEAGGRLGETLDRLAATLRERSELALKVQAKTSEARASAKIVASLVPFALGYMYLNSPRDFHFLLNDPTGNMVLFYSFASVSLGLIITQSMVRRVS